MGKNLVSESFKAYCILFYIFQGLKMLLVICNNIKKNFQWELEQMNVKIHKIASYTWNVQNFTCVFSIFVKFDIYFLGLPQENFFGVITDDQLYL